MSNHRFPRKGDRVIDTYLTDQRRDGVVKTCIFMHEEDDDDYIEVLWDNTPYGHGPEQLEYSTCFTQKNCGNGRWDSKQNAWLIERREGEEFLPANDPFVLSLNRGFEMLNRKLLVERLGNESKLPSYRLLLKSCEMRCEADDLGMQHPLFNWYFMRAEDYARMAAYNQE